MIHQTMSSALAKNFLGNSPDWYKQTIIGFLIFNPLVLFTLGPFIAGWLLILEFIFCLAMALKCYPLQPGGLLAIQAVMLGMTSPESVYNETVQNFPVIMLLMFMVAGIYFLKDLLLFGFTKILLKVESKTKLSFLFCFVAAVLSAFLDALTVTAVIITVAQGFYLVYHKVASGKEYHHEHDVSGDTEIKDSYRQDLDDFRAFLCSLMMHAAIGTALGGVCTLVGEPQNLLIAKIAGWEFGEFFMRMAPVSMPVLVTGLLTCVFLEKTKVFGFGGSLPAKVKSILQDYDSHQTERRTQQDIAKLWVQGGAAVFLCVALGFHLAEVGVIGLAVIVIATALNGVTEEHQIGHAFEEALPFTALLVVFFAVVAVIHEQHLFQPVTDFVLGIPLDSQPIMMFVANGVLSMISDNVFVATVYINEMVTALNTGAITREHFDVMAIAINTGTNLPSVATPNGQAAFLFLLTSALAPIIRLSYMKMVAMALPYTIVLSLVGGAAILYHF